MKTKTVIALAVPHSATGKVLKAEPGIRRRTLIKGMHRKTSPLAQKAGCWTVLIASLFWDRVAVGSTNDAGTVSPAVSRQADMDFLRDLTRDIVRASAVKPGAQVGGSPTNTCGFSLFMPGGHGGYPAFWVRDFAMSLDSGLFSASEISNHLVLIARDQNGPKPRLLRNGLIVPPFAIPDHVNFDGGAAFYPGTYSASDDQGDGTFGILPPVDDHYEFIHVAFSLFQITRDAKFLQSQINGLALLERLTAAFNAPETDQETGLVKTSAAKRAVGFGFCDGVYFTGKILFPSLLRYRAAGEFAEMCDASGKRDDAGKYRRIQKNISENLGPVFGASEQSGGWLQAATEVGRQADVWGTIYALHLGALQGDAARRARHAILEAVRRKTIAFEGAVRHVPTDLDYSTNSAWERTAGFSVNTYQNGAFWHTATGWLIEAVQDQDMNLAIELFDDYIRHLRRNDFRLGPGHEAPWECFHPPGYERNGVYMTSVTLPYAVLKARFPPVASR